MSDYAGCDWTVSQLINFSPSLLNLYHCAPGVNQDM